MRWLMLVAAFCCLLFLPSLLCCWAGGWLLLFGLLALGCWLWLGWWVLAAWLAWRRHADGDEDYV